MKAWYKATNSQGSYILNGWFFTTNDGFGSKIPKYEFVIEANVILPSRSVMFGDGIYSDTWRVEPISRAPTSTTAATTTRAGRQGGGGIGRLMIDRHGGVPANHAPRGRHPPARLTSAFSTVMWSLCNSKSEIGPVQFYHR